MYMKTNFLSSSFLILLCCIVFLSSCKDDNDDAKGVFRWNYKTVTYTANVTVVSSIEDLGPNITGGVGPSILSPGSRVSFKIIPLATGVYNIGTAGVSAIFVDAEGNSLQATGVVAITSTSNKRLSGNFSLLAGLPGSESTLTGVIENVPITP